MLFNNKSDFATTLSDQFRMSATWRKAQAKRYAYDGRNAEATRRLLALESEINIPDAVWARLEPLVSDSACLAVVSETNRDVGFRKHPADFTAWLENLHSNLTRA